MQEHEVTAKNLLSFYQSVRKQTEAICQHLVTEDYVIQSMEDVSPPKWHLAHTTWFFETFLLKPNVKNYHLFDNSFHHLFNSYYHQIGNPFPRPKRGVLARPTVETIYRFRQHVDQAVLDLIKQAAEEKIATLSFIITLGLHHEQQHQELLLMDIKHNLSMDPNFPAYLTRDNQASSTKKLLQLIETEGGIVDIGYHEQAFCFDNELPRHEVYLQPFALATRLVTNEEYFEFIQSDGYKQPEWWLADGWDCVQKNQWRAPLYWQQLENKWQIFTLHGLTEIDPYEPVSHVSFYEADAYARWRGMRLPLETEWEHFVKKNSITKKDGNFLETNQFHPQATTTEGPQQLFGDLWEWTASAYSSYPGYQPFPGAIGEYNGKFMSNQMVLRGGSCVTPQSHIRTSYRNFFQPDKRWQFSGIRLAQ